MREDNFYVTDSETGRIFVFDAGGKFKRNIGSLRGGEGYFKRPTGIAVDSAAQRIYVTDTLRNKVFVLDMKGSVMQTIGQTGTEHGEFNFPTEIALHGQDMAVVDAMNFRVQVFDRSGGFKYAVGNIGDERRKLLPAKRDWLRQRRSLYVVDAAWSTSAGVRSGWEICFITSGQMGTEPGAFSLPSGLFIDRNDTVYIVDSYNSRVQVFHYYGKREQGGGQ